MTIHLIEQVAAERSDAARDDRFRALVTQSAQIVWMTDAGGMTVHDSPQWQAFTGQSPVEQGDFGWLDAIHADDRPRARFAWKRRPPEVRPRPESTSQ